MSEYKENTVGWWLSQLKEPLKSRALGIVMDTSHPCDNLDGALTSVLNCLIEGSIMWTYWQGVYVYYFGGLHIDSTNFKDGFDIAHECDPWREDKAIVDSPEKPEKWIDYELWKWHEDVAKGGVEFADAERAKAKLDSDPPETKSWVDVEILKFRNRTPQEMREWYDKLPNVGEIEAHEPNEIPSMMTSRDELLSHGLGILGISPAPIDSWQESQDMATYSAIRNHPKLGEIEAPERAVVGYEEPKPIDTIEKKHELRIKNLEIEEYHQEKKIKNLQARVEQLEGIVGKLERQIEYININMPKSK